ncbi:MAG: hypothetical protein CK426_07080 [Legionella sp.]|nr:MAG: hypothetical protein CK423_04300 [Legionella sp.]PJD97985.1 MAG: hypothetical protein CK426_07080 [Legionella sp.]
MTTLDKYEARIDSGIYGEDIAQLVTQNEINIAHHINSYNNKPSELPLKSLSQSDYPQLKSTNLAEQSTLLYGTLLNGITSTADCWRTTADSTARAPLEKMQEHFKQLYSAPRQDTKIHINGLFDHLNSWLQLPHNDPVNQAQAISFCRSMHTILGIIRIQLEQSTKSWLIQVAIQTMTGLNIKESLAKIDNLLIAINDKHTSLTTMATADQEQVIEPNKQPIQEGQPLSSLQDILNEQFSDLIKTQKETQLITLETTLTETCSNLDSLIKLRTKKVTLDKEIQSASFELEQKRGQLKTLLNNKSNELPQSPQKLEPQKDKSFMKEIAKTIKVLFRKTTEKQTHSSLPIIESMAPVREEKNFITDIGGLKQEISSKENYIVQLQENAKGLENDITLTEKKITQDTHTIARTSTDTLQDILETTQKTKDVVTSYNQLSQKIDELDEMSSSVTKIIQKHNTWHVKLSNFMAKISSLFLTKTAKTINEAYSLQQEISQALKQCTQELESFNQQTHLLKTRPQSVKASSSDSTTDSITHFKEIKEQFENMKINKLAPKAVDLTVFPESSSSKLN